MESKQKNLEQLQTEWVGMQEKLRNIYPWLGEVGQPPSEELLKTLRTCNEAGWNTSCFAEGTCTFPGSVSCPFKERK